MKGVRKGEVRAGRRAESHSQDWLALRYWRSGGEHVLVPQKAHHLDCSSTVQEWKAVPEAGGDHFALLAEKLSRIGICW